MSNRHADYTVMAEFAIGIISLHGYYYNCQSQWPCGLRRKSVATRLLGLQVRIPLGHGFLSLVNGVYCQVVVSASGLSLVRRSTTECVMSIECGREVNQGNAMTRNRVETQRDKKKSPSTSCSAKVLQL